ncbi:Rho termination factor-like protein [Mumia flava]|uniref:Rho termination factor-like protein n=1 Tax=Mumia flava TaxID=1348852 RepID=A0A0B2BNH6_9ACTN|nr:Rho termination factor N-terminal domain-containing protein [Mumia flava]PJJ57306.1 Rho termination factor-like protein [Mumia flava]
MPGRKSPGPSVKDKKLYEELRDEGASKSKAARIANQAAKTSRSKVGRKGGKNPAYEDWSKQDLYDRAKEIGIEGRSSMSKSQLVNALRNS